MSAHVFCRRSLVLVLLVLGTLALGPLAPPLARAFSNGQAAILVLGKPTLTADGSSTPQPVSATEMNDPQAVTVDPATGKVFVADSANHRVLRFAARANLSNGAAAEAVLGQPDVTSATPAAGAQGMNGPNRLTVDRAGRLWVSDYGNHRVLRFDAAVSKPNGAPADGVLGQPDFTSNAWATSARGMLWPDGVAVDGSGRLWVVDEGNHRVLRFDAAAGKPNGAPADGVLGQTDFTSRAWATSRQGMNWPHGVAVDGAGRVWVADRNNNRVLRFDAAAGKPNGAPADGVLGQPNFTSGTSATSAQGMSDPRGLAVDGVGRLWVTDFINNRVLRFDAAASKPNGAPADGVLGQPDFTSSTMRLSPEGMHWPRGVGVDGSDGLWVADTRNNRVLLFDLSGQSSGTPTPLPVFGLIRTDSRADHSRCQYVPGEVSLAGVVAMPPGYQTATLQIHWYITNPAHKQTAPVYQLQTVQDGARINLLVPWPGVDPGDTAVHVYVGSVLLDPLTLKPIPDTMTRFSEYWYPWVCPAPVGTPTPTL